jgi:hypothetical protein
MNTGGYGNKELAVTCIILGVIAALGYAALLAFILGVEHASVNIGSMVGVFTYTAVSTHLERKRYATYSWLQLFVLFLAASLLGVCVAIGITFLLTR